MTCITQRHLNLGRSLCSFVLAALAAGALLVTAHGAHAAATPEQICQKGRYSAAARYAACQQKVLAKFFAGGGDHQAASGKCRTKYAAVWPKLQAKTPGSTCDTSRLTDNGTTVIDNLTGLQWEKKTDDSTIHDKDNDYSWSAGLAAADGTAFTTFLPALNSGGCFAGQCDWRLPTIYELQTILLGAYPCATSPCIDPVFGPTAADTYWAATTSARGSFEAWSVYFLNGQLYDFNFKGVDLNARAVRGGL